MADPTEKKNDAALRLTLPSKLKQEIDKTGNASAFIRRTVRRRIRAARRARARLEGWKKNELRAVLDLLDGTEIDHKAEFPARLYGEMIDAARVNDTPEKWGVGADRWEELAEEARGTPEVAAALITVAEEYWDGHGVPLDF